MEKIGIGVSLLVLEYILFGLAVVCGLVFFAAVKQRGSSAVVVISLVLAIAFLVLTFRLDSARLEKNRENADVLAGSAFLQGALANVSLIRSSDPPYRLAWEEQAALYAQRPYAVIRLSVDEESGTLSPQSLTLYSEGSEITPQALEACRTLVFTLSDTWATAHYSGTDSGTGTSERKLCYLYDVETGRMFAEGEIKADGLPKTSSGVPHHYVSNKQITNFIEEHMAA